MRAYNAKEKKAEACINCLIQCHPACLSDAEKEAVEHMISHSIVNYEENEIDLSDHDLVKRIIRNELGLPPKVLRNLLETDAETRARWESMNKRVEECVNKLVTIPKELRAPPVVSVHQL